jgi:outer membrane protein TolC
VVTSVFLTALPAFAQDTNGQQPSPAPAGQTDPLLKNQKAPAPPPQVEVKTPPPTPAVNPTALPSRLTLEQAVAYALRLQPNMAVAQANREEAQERQKSAQSPYYPTLTPVFQYNSNYNYGPTTQFIPAPGGGGTTVVTKEGSSVENRQAQLAFSYRLFDSGTRDLSARQARQNLRAQNYGEINTHQLVIADVASTYFAVLRDQALVKVADAQVARTQNTLDVVTAQVAAGVAAKKDVFQAQADLLNAQVTLLQSKNSAAISEANLKNAIGVVGGEPLQLAAVTLPTMDTAVTATVDGAPAPVGTAQDADLINRLENVAYQSRPDIAQSRQNVEALQTSSSLARVQTGVQVTGDVTAAGQFDPQHYDQTSSNNRGFSLNASYPLFDGGFVRSQFHASQAAARAGEAQLTSLRQQVAVEVEQAYRTLAQARAALPAVQAAQQAAQVNYEAAIASRREGVGSLVDVITAQTSLAQAQANYVQAVYAFYSADAALARAVGQTDNIAQIGNTSAQNAPLVNPVTAPAMPTPPANP